MVTEFKAKVRSDGAINMRKHNNALIGIKPGATVEVRIDTITGTARITPMGWLCSVCGTESKSPLNGLGMCKRCNAEAAKLIATGKTSDVSEAISITKSKYTPKVVKR